MKERPILFSGEMVRAILDGRKTQTRRVVKINGCIPMMVTAKSIEPYNGTKEQLINAMVLAGHSCKYGRPGDCLWVKETTIIAPKNFADPDDSCIKDADGDFRYIQYIASCACTEGADGYNLKKTPSIFMPRWASRITLEIVSVRVERLQEISEEDAKAEGVSKTRWFAPAGKPEGECRNLAAVGSVWNETWDAICYRNAYATLWEKINGAGSWDANPWVWVIEFKRVAL